MRKLFACLCTLIITLTACKKEVGENQTLDPKNQRKYDLMTNEIGSWWIYGGSDSTISRRIATGRDSTMKGFFFSYYERTDTTSATQYVTAEFFGKNNNNYVTLIDMDGTQTQYISVIFFKDGVNLGQSWTNIDQYSYSPWTFDIKIESKVVDTGQVMVLNGKTYTSVIQVHNDMEGKLPFPGSDYIDAGTLEIWFVKGIGIIKEDMNVVIGTNILKKVYRDSLLDYHLVQ